MKAWRTSWGFRVRCLQWIAVFSLVLFAGGRTLAATFSGSASIAAGGGSSLSASVANNAITVSCWFRMVIPTGTNLTENMVILMDRSDGDLNSTFSYLIQFNIDNGSIEFLTRGASGAYTNTLVARPYAGRSHPGGVHQGDRLQASQPSARGRSHPLEYLVITRNSNE